MGSISISNLERKKHKNQLTWILSEGITNPVPKSSLGDGDWDVSNSWANLRAGSCSKGILFPNFHPTPVLLPPTRTIPVLPGPSKSHLNPLTRWKPSRAAQQLPQREREELLTGITGALSSLIPWRGSFPVLYGEMANCSSQHHWPEGSCHWTLRDSYFGNFQQLTAVRKCQQLKDSLRNWHRKVTAFCRNCYPVFMQIPTRTLTHQTELNLLSDHLGS